MGLKVVKNVNFKIFLFIVNYRISKHNFGLNTHNLSLSEPHTYSICSLLHYRIISFYRRCAMRLLMCRWVTNFIHKSQNARFLCLTFRHTYSCVENTGLSGVGLGPLNVHPEWKRSCTNVTFSWRPTLSP